MSSFASDLKLGKKEVKVVSETTESGLFLISRVIYKGQSVLSVKNPVTECGGVSQYHQQFSENVKDRINELFKSVTGREPSHANMCSCLAKNTEFSLVAVGNDPWFSGGISSLPFVEWSSQSVKAFLFWLHIHGAFSGEHFSLGSLSRFVISNEENNHFIIPFEKSWVFISTESTINLGQSIQYVEKALTQSYSSRDITT
ncbi:hypothetical protein KKF34_02925 [Myxococcota bacterium]|nr:hypothetical protein [Myxococcota bacterium]MBU1382598.1 hypothetical protein [Myxococcota bacterium]MBU1495815.1 hypothetical protein [Myxococcota bacterium]